MKVNQLLALWKGDPRYTALSARAAALKKAGHSAEAIVARLTAEFGAPIVRARLRDAPQPGQVYGAIGSDIKPARRGFGMPRPGATSRIGAWRSCSSR